jgi:hypothetical protein
VPSTQRETPAFTKGTGGDWYTEYEERKLRASKRPAAEDKNARWAVYDVTDGRHQEAVFLAEGPTRGAAVVAAMDMVDEKDARTPLHDARQADWFITLNEKAFPTAYDFEPVGAAGAAVAGWTFAVDKGEEGIWYGWVSASRMRSRALVGERRQAESLLLTATAEKPRAAMAPAAAGAPLEGAVVSGEVTAKGTRPRHLDHPAIREALAALGSELPSYHPGCVRMAEVTDSFDLRNAETAPGEAWGALVLPEEGDETGSTVYGYWLEAGHWDRPHDVGAVVFVRMVAEKLSKRGFSIESLDSRRVRALRRAPIRTTGEGAREFTDVWVLTNESGAEVALVEARSDDAMMDLARCLPHVRAVLASEEEITRRRLSRYEVERRRDGHDGGLTTVVHHCEERGHQRCSAGLNLGELDPQGRGTLALAPVNVVEAVDGGTVTERRLPTYAKGTRLLGIDGHMHQVWETFWRTWDDMTVESVITADGREMPVSELTMFEGGRRLVETDARRGDTTVERSVIMAKTPLGELCPSGHRDVQDAAAALEHFRTAPVGDREQWLKDAESAAMWAAAKFFQATGELTVGTWRMVTRYAVELVAGGLALGRSTALDAQPARNSFFGEGRRKLEERCPQGHQRIMTTSRHWYAYMSDLSNEGELVKADASARTAALELAGEFEGTQVEWIAPARYLAEAHVMALMDKAAHAQATRRA